MALASIYLDRLSGKLVARGLNRLVVEHRRSGGSDGVIAAMIAQV